MRQPCPNRLRLLTLSGALLLPLLLCLPAFAAGSAPASSDGSISAWHPLSCADCHQVAAPTAEPSDSKACIKCHGDYDALIDKDREHPDPSGSHQAGLACFGCHKQHEPSVYYCGTCHAEDQKDMPEKKG